VRLTLLTGLLLWQLVATGQSKTVYYTEDTADIVNPERGFYIPYSTTAGNFVPLQAAPLQRLRSHPQRLSGATYSITTALIYRAYELDTFKDKPLSEAFLEQLQSDFNVVREAGLKMILRFAYTNTSHNGNCKGEYDICPPYGDAPVAVVLNHVKQLKPLLRKHADVIAVLQEGFIGIWGENYFTDYFGDASSNDKGIIPDSGWQYRNQLLKTLLDALPENRMVQVRTPQIKQKYIYGMKASVNSAPVTAASFVQGSAIARIGMHNDCFLSSPDDYGTYYDYGSSTQPRVPANEVLRRYTAADTRYTVMGGETCDDAFSPQNDCPPFGRAEDEMREMHYSYLNAAYNNKVNNDWDSCQCMLRIKRSLGYRLVLQKAVLPVKVKKGTVVPVVLMIQNQGYAAPFNPRPVLLVLRNQRDSTVYTIPLKTNVRKWFSGAITISENLPIPAGMSSGNWELLLSLPDAAVTLQNRPAYSIRLANAGLWEEAGGYNNLQHVITIP
jgi:hypothetical protein